MPYENVGNSLLRSRSGESRESRHHGIIAQEQAIRHTHPMPHLLNSSPVAVVNSNPDAKEESGGVEQKREYPLMRMRCMEEKLFRCCDQRDFPSLLSTIQDIISPLLLGKRFETPDVVIMPSSKDGFYAEYEPKSKQINLYPHSLAKLGLDPVTNIKALIIIFIHELTHVWQHQYAPDASREDMEGHAVYVQSQFAGLMGWQAVNELGVKMLMSDGTAESKRLYGEMPKKYFTMFDQGIDAASEAIMRFSQQRAERKNINHSL